MIIGIGTDLLEVSRMEAEIGAGANSAPADIFTDREIAYCRSKRYPARHYAARFAAKEALFKALAVDRRTGMVWREAEVVNDEAGRPRLQLYGSLEERARQLSVRTVLVTLTHTAQLAAA